MASKELETAIGVVLLNNREIALWSLSDIRELRERLCEAVANVSVLKAMASLPGSVPEGSDE